MKATIRCSFFFEMEQGEARDLLHDLTKIRGCENRASTKKLVDMLNSLLPDYNRMKDGIPQDANPK